MATTEAAADHLNWFAKSFLAGGAQSDWVSRLKSKAVDRTKLSVFNLWDRKSRRNELCVFWRRSIDDLRETLRALGLSKHVPLVVGTGHGSDFGVATVTFDEVFSKSLDLLEGLIFFGQQVVLAENHSGGLCICCIDAGLAEEIRARSRVGAGLPEESAARVKTKGKNARGK